MSELPTHIGPYAITAELGRGGMGVVYRAHRSDLGRDFALKVILPEQLASPGVVERFRREAQAAAQLGEHPGIVAVHDIGEADGKLYFAMDYIQGQSVEDALRGEPMAPARAAAVVEQAARAVHFAHAKGVLHRDLKPANLLLTPAGGVRVTDFGLAALQEADAPSARLTRSGVILGTAAYMPPEQARSQTLDARADVYALGATLYECLTGAPPFGDGSVFEVLGRVIREEPQAPRRSHAGVPQDMETITLKCLEKDPDRRYPTAEALAADLARYQAGEPIAARPVGRLERMAKHVRRHRAPWAVGATLGAVVLGLAAVLGVRAATDAAAVAAEFEAARAMIDVAPDEAAGRLAQLADRAGADYPGLREARARTVSARERLRRAELLRQVRYPLQKATDAAATYVELTRILQGTARMGAQPPPGQQASDPRRRGVAEDDIWPEPMFASWGTDPKQTAALEQARESEFIEAASSFRSVLEVLNRAQDAAPYEAARDGLVTLLWRRLREADAAGDVEGAGRFRVELREWDTTGRFAALTDGGGSISLETAPAGAVVRILRYREHPTSGVDQVPMAFEPRCPACRAHPDRLEAHEAHTPLPKVEPLWTPLERLALPMGSYLLLIDAPGRRQTRYPVVIEPATDFRVDVPIPLLTDAQIGDEYRWIPPGWSIVGQRDPGPTDWRRAWRWVDGICLAEREVSCGDYLEFLQARLAQGGPDAEREVRRRLPRQAPTGSPFWTLRDGAIDVGTWKLQWSVVGVSGLDALAYCAWRSGVEHRRVRLPTELEWCRAARGADGREFPWGYRFPSAFTYTAGSPVPRVRDAAGKNPLLATMVEVSYDESPFGVRYMGGSVREMCGVPRKNSRYPFSPNVRGHTLRRSIYHLNRLTGSERWPGRDVGDGIGFRVAAEPRP